MADHIHTTELVRVGRSSCLHRWDSGATALLDTHTAWLWKERQVAGAPERLRAKVAWRIGLTHKDAEAYIGAFEAQLESSGFLIPAARHSPIATQDTHEQQRPARLISLRYGFEGEAPAVFETNDPELAERIGANVLPIEYSPGTDVTTRITAQKKSDHYTIARDGVVLLQKCDDAAVRRVVIYCLMQALLPRASIAAILHASTVSRDGKGIVLAGSTGSGKTTLMMHLVSRGAHYFCDDFSALDEQGAKISNFPLAASLKAPVWDVLRPDFPELDAASPLRIGNRTVRYLQPDTRKSFRRECIAPRLLVFPKYSEGAETTCTALYPEEALAQLVQSGSELVSGQKTIQPLANFVNRTPAINLAFGSVQEAASAIRREVDRLT